MNESSLEDLFRLCSGLVFSIINYLCTMMTLSCIHAVRLVFNERSKQNKIFLIYSLNILYILPTYILHINFTFFSYTFSYDFHNPFIFLTYALHMFCIFLHNPFIFVIFLTFFFYILFILYT